LAALEAEQGLPTQVARALPPGHENVATALTKVIDPLLRRGILERSADLLPQGRFSFTPLELAEARQFLSKHRARLNRFYQALDRPQCAFPIDYRLGYFFEPAFVDDVTICCRLLAFAAADLLAKDSVADALRPMEAQFQLAGCMGRERHLGARLSAVGLRAEALLVMEAIANHPDSRHVDLQSLSSILQRELSHWPADAEAMIGDRALTLHAYECLRRGLLDWILTADERKRFREELTLDSLGDIALVAIDQDEQFYLETMRRHVELCREPYFRRRGELAKLSARLDQSRTSAIHGDYPHFAALLFLPGMDQAHETLARDRARCEAMAIALEIAIGRDPPDYTINPHNGRPYEIVRESQRVVVRWNKTDERDVAVALPTP
jgi:hypothetical protein